MTQKVYFRGFSGEGSAFHSEEIVCEEAKRLKCMVRPLNGRRFSRVRMQDAVGRIRAQKWSLHRES